MNEGTGQPASASGAAQARVLDYIKPGLTSITPYIVIRGASEFIEFLKAAFDGAESLRVPTPDGLIVHAEVSIGNGAIELADANEHYPSSPTDIHLYVEDCDATYERALGAGAKSIYAPADQPWGDRQGAVQDAFGNHWYIATAQGWTPGPEGLRSVQPYLHLRGADRMIPFLEEAFGAENLGVAKSSEGLVLHATIRIGDATLEIDEAGGEFQPKPCHLHIYVPNTDAVYERALLAGGSSIESPQDKPYGDRAAGVKDAFGNSWFIATYRGMK
jgi:PhnB protein